MELISLGLSVNSFGVCLHISKRWGLEHPCRSFFVLRFWLFICGGFDVQKSHVACMLAVLARDEIALCQRSHLQRDGWARQSGACGQSLLLGPALVLVVGIVGKRE